MFHVRTRGSVDQHTQMRTRAQDGVYVQVLLVSLCCQSGIKQGHSQLQSLQMLVQTVLESMLCIQHSAGVQILHG